MVLEELSEEQAVDVVEQTMTLDDGDDMEDVEQDTPAYSIVMDAPILAFPVATEQAPPPTVFLVDEDDKMVGSSAVDDLADYEDTFDDVEMYSSRPILAPQETLAVVPATAAISKSEVDAFLSSVPLPSGAVDVAIPEAPQSTSVAPVSSEELPDFVASEACIGGSVDVAHLTESDEASTIHKTREGKQCADPCLEGGVGRHQDATDDNNTGTSTDDTTEGDAVGLEAPEEQPEEPKGEQDEDEEEDEEDEDEEEDEEDYAGDEEDEEEDAEHEEEDTHDAEQTTGILVINLAKRTLTVKRPSGELL
ncbi:hypothetical protein B0H21DRAFT_890163 [Amylocystis lapponica]|nr:hypothetical protein B0H21DRAFT_890163 [Amylocystis lapponica]